ncbi:fumarylacetoacetate hydrolase family protein [Nocardia sp. CA-135398]|uniref:fumarylacetoacetate hydrolase family protein n=1 Tax=Nocardia sp. CA-135398 TaxID=3239977 RepID=UPI003D98AF08
MTTSIQPAANAETVAAAKSHPGFGPIGPWLTTLDELPNPSDLAIETRLDDELVQSGRTGSMIFGVATLVSYLSQVCELMPGDLIFTGTPSGVGHSRIPPRFLTPGTTAHSTIEGLGELHNLCAADYRTPTEIADRQLQAHPSTITGKVTALTRCRTVRRL